MSSNRPNLSDNVEKPNRLVPAGTPNDGFPDHWKPVHDDPIRVGQRYMGPESGPPSAPIGPGPYFAASIPPVMQLPTDIAITGYPGGLGAYRIMPPGPSGNPQANAAAQSATGVVRD
jgi:hypothetical protein